MRRAYGAIVRDVLSIVVVPHIITGGIGLVGVGVGVGVGGADTNATVANASARTSSDGDGDSERKHRMRRYQAWWEAFKVFAEFTRR